MLSLARTHKLAPRKRHVLPAGFWDEVYLYWSEGGGECWIWTRALSSSGYGVFRRKGKNYYAHRVALQWVTQKEGKYLHATHGPCHRKHCVNPAHLSWKTPKGNVADMVRDGTINRGRRNGANKLAERQVLAIRADTRTQLQIAKDYGIHQVHVSSIKNRRSWAWLE